MLKVSEIFSSIQGEGILTGVPMTFIRLSGCNLSCRWCDTTYAQSENKNMTEEEIATQVHEFPNNWVCVTGGEPLLQDLRQLFYLLSCRYHLTIETNGTLDMPIDIFGLTTLLTISPKLSNSGMLSKLNKNTLSRLLEHQNPQLKFVCESAADVTEALKLCTELSTKLGVNLTKVPIVFQPQGLATATIEEYLAALRELWKIVQEAKSLYPWDLRVLPQLHRLLFGSKRGV